MTGQRIDGTNEDRGHFIGAKRFSLLSGSLCAADPLRLCVATVFAFAKHRSSLKADVTETESRGILLRLFTAERRAAALPRLLYCGRTTDSDLIVNIYCTGATNSSVSARASVYTVFSKSRCTAARAVEIRDNVLLRPGVRQVSLTRMDERDLLTVYSLFVRGTRWSSLSER